jgi:hypothetical protein
VAKAPSEMVGEVMARRALDNQEELSRITSQDLRTKGTFESLFQILAFLLRSKPIR